jgi:hypothetical protein
MEIRKIQEAISALNMFIMEMKQSEQVCIKGY